MGFMEMKRANEGLLSEIQALKEDSKLRESKHQDTIDRLTQEIKLRESKHQDTIDKLAQEILTTKVNGCMQTILANPNGLLLLAGNSYQVEE